MSTAYNHMKRSHRSQRGHYMAQAQKYVKNAQAHNKKDKLTGPMTRLSRLIKRNREKSAVNGSD